MVLRAGCAVLGEGSVVLGLGFVELGFGFAACGLGFVFQGARHDSVPVQTLGSPRIPSGVLLAPFTPQMVSPCNILRFGDPKGCTLKTF